MVVTNIVFMLAPRSFNKMLVSKNYPHSNVLYALYASAHVYMKCGNNVLGANINTMLATTIGMTAYLNTLKAGVGTTPQNKRVSLTL